MPFYDGIVHSRIRSRVNIREYTSRPPVTRVTALCLRGLHTAKLHVCSSVLVTGRGKASASTVPSC
jgi:hypothetical protein